jgi:hypothetical protein
MMAKLPQGPTPLHKNMAVGMDRKSAEAKALEKKSAPPKKR